MPLAPKMVKLTIKLSLPFVIVRLNAGWPAADDAEELEATPEPAFWLDDLLKLLDCPVKDAPVFGSKTRKLE